MGLTGSVTVQLGCDNSSFVSELRQAVTEGEKFADRLKEKVGDKLYGLRDVSHVVASALGLNLEQIAENVARAWTGMSKEAEEAAKRTAELSTQLADQAIAEMRQRTTLENQLKLALQDRERLQVKITDLQQKENEHLTNTQIGLMGSINPLLAITALYGRLKDTTKEVVELAEQETAAVKANAEVMRIQSEEKKKQLELAGMILSYNANERDHAAKMQGFAAELTAANQNLLAAKQKLAAAEAGTVDQGKALLEVQKARFAAEDIALKHQVEGNLTLQQQQEQAVLQAKAKHDLTTRELDDAARLARFDVEQAQSATNLTGIEQTKLNILRLQSDIKKNQRDIDDVLKSNGGVLNDKQEHQVLVLDNQNKELQKQIVAQEALIAGAANRVKVEADVTAEIEKQTAAAAAAAAKARNWDGAGMPLGLRNLSSVSNDALTASARQYQAELDRMRSSFQPSFSTPDISGDFGYSFTASQLGSIQQELAFRSKITGAFATGGRTGALGAYVAGGGNALSFDTAIANMSSWNSGSTQTSQQLGQIVNGLTQLNTRLQNNGVDLNAAPRL